MQNNSRRPKDWLTAWAAARQARNADLNAKLERQLPCTRKLKGSE